MSNTQEERPTSVKARIIGGSIAAVLIAGLGAGSFAVIANAQAATAAHQQLMAQVKTDGAVLTAAASDDAALNDATMQAGQVKHVVAVAAAAEAARVAAEQAAQAAAAAAAQAAAEAAAQQAAQDAAQQATQRQAASQQSTAAFNIPVGEFFVNHFDVESLSWIYENGINHG